MPIRRTLLLAMSVVLATLPLLPPAAARAMTASALSVPLPAEYVIITKQSLAPEFTRLARWKNRLGVPASVQTMESIVAAYPAGRDDAERVRFYLQDLRLNYGTRYVLLGGDASVVPVRYARTTFYGVNLLPTDLYYAALDGDWNADGDSFWGEGYQSPADPGDDADLVPDVWVGRAPVRNAAEAHLFVDKAIHASQEPLDPRAHAVLLAAEALFPSNWVPGEPLSFDGADVTEPLRAHLDHHTNVHTCRLYENWMDPRWVGSLPLTHTSLIDSLNSGFNLVVHVGGGFGDTLGGGTPLMNGADALSLTNAIATTVYTFSGAAAAVDQDAIGRSFLLAPHGGTAAVIGGSTFGFPTASRSYLDEFMRLVYDADVSAVGEAAGRQGLPFVQYSQYDGVNRWVEMTNTLLGDPEMRLFCRAGAPLVLSTPAELAAGSTGFDVQVSAGGVATVGARVSAWSEDDQLVLATTDATGHAFLPYEATNEPTCVVTVTTSLGERVSREIAVSGLLGAPSPIAGAGLRLERLAPNPARGPLRVAYVVGAGVQGRMSLAVYDASGRQVRALARQDAAPGRSEVVWDLRSDTGAPVRDGLYFVRVIGAGHEASGRVLVLR